MLWEVMPGRMQEYIRTLPESKKQKIREMLTRLLEKSDAEDVKVACSQLDMETHPFTGFWDRPWVVVNQYLSPLNHLRQSRREAAQSRLNFETAKREQKRERPVLEGSSWEMVEAIIRRDEEAKAQAKEEQHARHEKQLPPTDRTDR